MSPGARERLNQLRRQSFLQDELPDMFRQIHLLGIPLEEIAAMYETYLSENGENS